MNRHYVTVCGQSLMLVSDEDEAYVREITRTINGIIAEFNSKRPMQGITTETRLIYAAIQLADEMFKERQKVAVLEERLRTMLEGPNIAPETLDAAERKNAVLTDALKNAIAERDALRAERDMAKAELKTFIEEFDVK